MKTKDKLIKYFIIFLLFIVSFTVLSSTFNVKKIKPFSEFRIIAHGMGGYDNVRVSNSKEAFLQNYNKGIRVFEVDLIETSDNFIVARHDWGDNLYSLLGQKNIKKDKSPLSLREFKNLNSKFNITMIDLNDIIELMVKYNDVYIVTDTKTPDVNDATRVFTKIVSLINEINPSILNRIVPQIYNQQMYNVINNIYEFENILYTLYMDLSTDDEVLNFAVNNNIAGIVMSENRYNKSFVQDLLKHNIPSYIHTINDLDVANNYLDNGIYGVYTDFLVNKEIKTLPNNR